MPDEGTLTSRRRAVSAAAAIFLLGFCALNIFMLLGLGQPRLPGLYTFRAATIGDGLLLPLLAYCLVRSASPPWPASRYEAVLAGAGGFLGMSIGAAVQVYALLDPDSRLDWTFPAPHSYNLPGWYHTGFLILASGFYGWALGLLLARMRNETSRDPEITIGRIRSIGPLGILFPGLAFIGLLEEDDLSGLPAAGEIMLGTLMGVAAILCAALYWACGGRQLRLCAMTAMSSLLPAIALCGIFLPGLTVSPVAVAGCCLAGAAAVALFTGGGMPARGGAAGSRPEGLAAARARCCLAACQALCAAGPVYAVLAGKPASASVIATGFLAGLVLAGCETCVFAPLR
jgi:hypothetical protein